MYFDLIDICNFFGLVYPCNSGVVFTNQTGGTCCAHPEIEGVYFPLDLSWMPNVDPLIDWWDNYNIEMVNKFLSANEHLNRSFRPLDKEELTNQQIVAAVMEETDYRMQFGEAWIPVIVQDLPDDPLKPLANKLVILTYENSD